MLEERFVKAIRSPRSVAVIGASREPHKVGHAILKNVVETFRGKVYPINPRADRILGLKCYPSVLNVEDDIDVAVIAVPASVVPQVLEDCGKKGIPFVIIISAGFREIGREGLEREREVLRIARRYGIRVLGPNCLGYIDTHIPLNITFSYKLPPRGGVGIISQSGAVITTLMDVMTSRGVGVSKVISLGNKVDINEVDFLKILGEDENTNVIAMYLESVESGREFIDVASRVSLRKPVIVIKAGRSESGARAVSSHTGALAGYYAAYRAAFRQSGLIEVDSLEDLVLLSHVMSRCKAVDVVEPIVVTNAGGPGVLMADFCERFGVKLKQLSADIIDDLRGVLPPAASLHNPIDILGDATPERYNIVLERLLQRRDVKVVVVLVTPQAMTRAAEVANVIASLSNKYSDKIVIPVFIGEESMREAHDVFRRFGIPYADYPEKAARALSYLAKYVDNLNYLRRRLEQEHVVYDVDTSEIDHVMRRARDEGRAVLLVDEAFRVLDRMGIKTPKTMIARDADEAVRFADEIGYPVVLKVVSPQIVHKSDIGCVKVGLRSPEDVRASFYEILDNALRYVPHARIYGVAVQKMVRPGREVIVGATRDPQFGHLVMFGLGGIYVELFRDVSFRVAPLKRVDAEMMVRETKAYRMLAGYRGERPVDMEKIVDLVLRTSYLVTRVHGIESVDLNPVIVYEDDYVVVDAKIVVSLS